MSRHNHIAVWVMVFALQGLGMAWYGLFSEPWVAGQGKTMEQLQNMEPDPTPYIFSFICAILSSYVISWLVIQLNKDTFAKGASLGIILFLGLSGASMALHYPFLGMSYTVLAIDLGMTLVATVLTAGVLAAWRKKEKV